MDAFSRKDDQPFGMQHSCSKCKNPFPYQCEHCIKAVAANDSVAKEAATAIAKAQTVEQPPIKKKFIGSGEDAYADLYVA